ncbi:MAG: hypothetical protein GC192_17675 [Bacteroidetes bacterium]|nr:hypothetical protein [Bacteroidota bacterium]
MTLSQYLDNIAQRYALGNATEHTFRGVWYMPAPVVSFIVRAVDEVLKTEFGLPSGLADISKVKKSAHPRQALNFWLQRPRGGDALGAKIWISIFRINIK